MDYCTTYAHNLDWQDINTLIWDYFIVRYGSKEPCLSRAHVLPQNGFKSILGCVDCHTVGAARDDNNILNHLVLLPSKKTTTQQLHSVCSDSDYDFLILGPAFIIWTNQELAVFTHLKEKTRLIFLQNKKYSL